jgi:hypothetical protein
MKAGHQRPGAIPNWLFKIDRDLVFPAASMQLFRILQSELVFSGSLR